MPSPLLLHTKIALYRKISYFEVEQPDQLLIIKMALGETKGSAISSE